MQPAHQDPAGFIVSFLLISVFALGGVVLLVRWFKRQPLAERPVSVAPPSMMPEREQARCVCGEVATEPSPTLERSRGTVIRDLFSMPPRYRRVVNMSHPLLYCRSHSHVADSLLAEFIAVRVRARFTQAYAEVARDAAAFEQEQLARAVADSLTEQQRKAVRRVTLKVVTKTGTDDTPAPDA